MRPGESAPRERRGRPAVTTIDRSGRIVTPRTIRAQAALEPGIPLEIRGHDGRVELEPARRAVRLVRRGHFMIAEPERRSAPLRGETVERSRRRLHRERGSGG